MSKKTFTLKEEIDSQEKTKNIQEGYCPVIRIEDIRRVKEVSDDLFSEDEDVSPNHSKNNSLERRNLSNERNGVIASIKSKEDKGFKTNPIEIEDNNENNIPEDFEFKIFVRQIESEGSGRKAKHQNRKGSTVWIDKLEELVKGIELILRKQIDCTSRSLCG